MMKLFHTFGSDKITKVAFTLLLMAMPVAFSSCSLMQKKTVKIEAQLPSDRSELTQAVESSYRSSALEHGKIEGYWRIATVSGRKPSGPDAPYLKFVRLNDDENRVYGSNGCNTINADYTCNPADSTLKFSQVLTTMRACPDAQTDALINQAIDLTERYTISRRGKVYTLSLCSGSGAPLMTLTHQDYDYLNGTWGVKGLNGKDVKCPDMLLVIDVEEGRIHGNTGCNILNGTLIPDMLEQGVVSFQNLSTTRMSCPNINLENMLLVALEQTVNVRPVDANTVDMLDSTGSPILTLTRQQK